MSCLHHLHQLHFTNIVLALAPTVQTQAQLSPQSSLSPIETRPSNNHGLNATKPTPPPHHPNLPTLQIRHRNPTPERRCLDSPPSHNPRTPLRPPPTSLLTHLNHSKRHPTTRPRYPPPKNSIQTLHRRRSTMFPRRSEGREGGEEVEGGRYAGWEGEDGGEV